MGRTKSEEFVERLCSRTFLSLWSYPNPHGKHGDELCDFLAVCDPDVLVFSVKEIKVSDSGNSDVDWARWWRRAIEKSVKQLDGAVKHLARSPAVVSSDGTTSLSLPDPASRRIHRIAIAMGGEGRMPLISGVLGAGYVHVFDARSIETVLGHLDTVTDFTAYLRAVEGFSGRVFVDGGTAEDLLAVYLGRDRSFPRDIDLLIVEGGAWSSFRATRQYPAKKKADRVSYFWDDMIEELCADTKAGRLVDGTPLVEAERGIRIMAREDRFARRGLASDFLELLNLSRPGGGARLTSSASGVAYVFLAKPLAVPREQRRRELLDRCFVARGHQRQCQTVIAIATEVPVPGQGHSLDLAWLHKPDWTAQDEADAIKIRGRLGYFANPRKAVRHEEEYPI